LAGSPQKPGLFLVRRGMTMHDVEIKTMIVDDEEIQVVDAREFHVFLKVNTRFVTWFKRKIREHDFKENQDYFDVTQPLPNDMPESLRKINRRKDYVFSFNAVCELLVLEKSEEGKGMRKYLIEQHKNYEETFFTKGQEKYKEIADFFS
jgi:anti-repressor protein